MKALGVQILSGEFRGLTSWKWPSPDEIKAREAEIDSKLSGLEEASKQQRAAFTSKLGAAQSDDAAREAFREQQRQWNAEHAQLHKSISEFASASEAYLQRKEDVDSVATANTALAALKAHESEQAAMQKDSVMPLKVSASIVTRFANVDHVVRLWV